MGREAPPCNLPNHRSRCVEIRASNLWSVGFTFEALGFCQHLSGLVEVHEVEVQIVEGKPIVYFFVSNNDKTNVLFQSGLLGGTKIDSFYKGLQGIFVEFRRVSST